jgi:hypothetical protein
VSNKCTGNGVIVGNYAEWRVGFLNYVYEKGGKADS